MGGNGRHAAITRSQANAAGLNGRLFNFEQNLEAQNRFIGYCQFLGLEEEQYYAVPSDILAEEGIIIGNKLGNAALSMMDENPQQLLSDNQFGIPYHFAHITDCGGTGCYPHLEDGWEDKGISSFGGALSTQSRRAGQITAKRNIWKHVAGGGSYMFDSMNLVDPLNPNNGQLPLIDYLRYVIGWKGLVPSTIRGDCGIKNEIGIFPIIKQAGLKDLDKILVHVQPHVVFNCYELLKAA
jgi:hypothetical protein